jgi:plastocyanin
VSNPILASHRMGGVGVKPLVASALVALLGAVGSARADNGTLVGDVGQGDAFVISLTDSTGAKVTHLNPGTYTLLVHDRSSFHNFDLNGPGVSAATDVDGVGDKTFTVTFVDGTYFFQCDPHSSQMRGQFTVGTVTTPPPPTTTPKPSSGPATVLAGSIGPGARFSLSPSSGLAAGTFRITISDRSAADGFRLAGPGVARSTGVKFKGSVTWRVTLKAGKYTFGSLRNPNLRHSFSISS